jgi:pimeloyl-ACP methyl ester carboxylesterase
VTTLVLVHPAWLGGWCWRKLVPLLRVHGHEVHTPTLTGLGERAHLAHPRIDLHVHVTDIVNVLVYEDLHDVVLLGTSSAGMVITGVAEHVPERIGHLIYLDAFVPDDGQCLLDLVPADRRAAMEAQVESEGDGWLLPRFAATPWDQFIPQAWQVTNPADLAWMLARLRPTPFGQFTTGVRRGNPAAVQLPRTYIRCTRWPHAGFDRHAQAAEQTTGWRLHRLDASHLPYITSHGQLAAMLLELAADAPAPRPLGSN